jgi:hypothetical protein
MSKVLGQPVVVVNKAGAGGTMGATEVANAAKDGHTMGMLPVGPMTTQPNLRTLPYGPDSFDYVCLVYSNPQLLLVRADAPYKTYGELVAHAKANPGKLNYGSSGIGSVPHLAVVALAKAANIDVFHVPHKGEADALASILGGHITMFVSHPTFRPRTPTRSARCSSWRPTAFPTIRTPTIVEQGGPALSFEVWGAGGAEGTPRPCSRRWRTPARWPRPPKPSQADAGAADAGQYLTASPSRASSRRNSSATAGCCANPASRRNRMNSYQRVFAALAREMPDRVPVFECSLASNIIDALAPGGTLEDVVDRYDLDAVSHREAYRYEEVDRDKQFFRDEWGIREAGGERDALARGPSRPERRTSRSWCRPIRATRSAWRSTRKRWRATSARSPWSSA